MSDKFGLSSVNREAHELSQPVFRKPAAMPLIVAAKA